MTDAQTVVGERRRQPTKREAFWQWVGGRKQANGLLYALLITGMVFPLHGDFSTYCGWLAGALLGTSAIVAMEDRGKPTDNGFPHRRVADAPPPSPPSSEK